MHACIMWCVEIIRDLNLYHVPAYIGTGQIMGWGSKAIEIRSLEAGSLEGVFMHKRTQKLKFLCERNDKVSETQPTFE